MNERTNERKPTMKSTAKGRYRACRGRVYAFAILSPREILPAQRSRYPHATAFQTQLPTPPLPPSYFCCFSTAYQPVKQPGGPPARQQAKLSSSFPSYEPKKDYLQVRVKDRAVTLGGATIVMSKRPIRNEEQVAIHSKRLLRPLQLRPRRSTGITLSRAMGTQESCCSQARQLR